jgi:hypothetical protein
MMERNDIHAEFHRSPRIIVVEDPSTELTQQDLVDTLRGVIEPSWDGIDNHHLHKSSGKESLGGGVSVGITVTLEDALVSFEAVNTSTSSGATDAADPSGNLLTDNEATFQTDGIVEGDVIINFSDKSITTAIKVLSETQIQHYPLSDGANNDWEIGDEYKIFHIKQCIVTGGNLTAEDKNGNPYPSPISPSAFTQIILTTASSATLQELEEIQHASFNERVTIDTVNGVSGTAYPIGTQKNPVNNLNDAKIIAKERGFNDMFIKKPGITFSPTDDICGFIFTGDGPEFTAITVEDGALTSDAVFMLCAIDGTMNGAISIKECHVLKLVNFQGIITDSVLRGNISLTGISTSYIFNCNDGCVELCPTIDMGGSGRGLTLGNYTGEIAFSNKTGPEYMSINIIWELEI